MIAKGDIRIFNDGVAIVTGAASGIGRALSDELSRRGCEVILADLQIELAEKVAADIQSKGGKAKAVQLDVTDFTAVQELVSDTVNHTGRLPYRTPEPVLSLPCHREYSTARVLSWQAWR